MLKKKLISAAAVLLAIISLQPWAFAVSRPDTLIPMGQTAGVRLDVKGLIVVGYAEDAKNETLKPGDFITRVNNKPARNADFLREQLENAGENGAKVTLIRQGETVTVSVKPVDGKVGVLVRDTVSGIGTVTFYDPASGIFGALGHGISASDSKLPVPIEDGQLIKSRVADVQKGLPGKPGELRGAFDGSGLAGRLGYNTEHGLFGVIDDPNAFRVGQYQKPTPLASPNDVQSGKAQILCNITGDTVEAFEIELTKLTDGKRDFSVRVTDSRLIEKTGGIVQGMSGSPILQNGKFVGAVTHVLVGEPQKGYGISIDNMLNEIYKNSPKGEFFTAYQL